MKSRKEKAAIFKAERAKPKTPGREAKVRENTRWWKQLLLVCFSSPQELLSLAWILWKPFDQENSAAKPDTNSMHLAPGLRQFKAALTQHSEATSAPLCVYVISDSGRIPSVTYKVLPHALYLYRSPLNSKKGGKHAKLMWTKKEKNSVHLQSVPCASSHVTVRVISRLHGFT